MYHGIGLIECGAVARPNQKLHIPGTVCQNEGERHLIFDFSFKNKWIKSSPSSVERLLTKSTTTSSEAAN